MHAILTETGYDDWFLSMFSCSGDETSLVWCYHENKTADSLISVWGVAGVSCILSPDTATTAATLGQLPNSICH